MPSGSLTGLLDFCLNPAHLQELQGVAMAIQQWHNDNKNVSMTFWLPCQVMLWRVTSSTWCWTCKLGVLEWSDWELMRIHLYIHICLNVHERYGFELIEVSQKLSHSWWNQKTWSLLTVCTGLNILWASNPAEYTFPTVLLHEWTSVGGGAGHLPVISVRSIFSPQPRSLLSQQVHKRSKIGRLALVLPSTSSYLTAVVVSVWLLLH